VAKTKYVAGKPVEIGLGARDESGVQGVQHFEPGEEVAGAADLEGLQGLVRNGWLVPQTVFVENDGLPPELVLIDLAEQMEEATP
jgi:hypothetical protein